MYTPTANAVGDLSKSSTYGFAKLSDAAINAIPADKNGYSYFKLQDEYDEYEPDVLMVRTKMLFTDTALGFGWNGNYDLCNTLDLETCRWKSAGVHDKHFETMEAFGDTCGRWFADYSNTPHSWTVNCFEESNKHRCFTKGAPCDHANRDHVTMYKWSPKEIVEDIKTTPKPG